MTQDDSITQADLQSGRLPSGPIIHPKAEPLYEEFLGMTAVIASLPMRRLLALTCRVARLAAPVLITGESGTGKELIARAVHQMSPRAAKPFIDLNCAALPEHLIESELFGYEKGAFSGADQAKPGLLEAASGGTLFLDEIGEMDARLQAKLLRVLDGHPYFRLGGSRKVVVDARFIAATNLDLDEAVRAGRFRKDLYYRLDGFHLHLPPLRERREDIAPLAGWFLRDMDVTLGTAAMTVLENYSWPGNVRELQNAMNKAALLSTGPEIVPGDLPMDVFPGFGEEPGDEYSLDDLEKQTIRRVLEQTGGHQQKAAERLGISRRTLIRKLKLYRSFASECEPVGCLRPVGGARDEAAT
jgi:transcriptional regulator with PAS, ATPase and Fis domain